MREINTKILKEAVSSLCLSANTTIDADLYEKFSDLYRINSTKKLNLILKNIELAQKTTRPLCQDTGQVILFVKIGRDTKITGESIEKALNEAVENAYKDNYFRKSTVNNSLFDRQNTGTNTPAIIYYEFSQNSQIEIDVLIKGAGSENYSALKMFNPADSKEDIFKFIKNSVQNAGERACPPLILGIGAGGTADYAAILSKKAFFTEMSKEEEAFCAKLLDYLDCEDVIDAKLLSSSTHIASLPVALTINCHCLRHAGCIIDENGIKYTKKICNPREIQANNTGIPLKTSDITKIKALNPGDEVLLTGEIYTARDAAHLRIENCLKSGKELPIDLKNKIIFYAGPCPAAPGEIIGPVGPTTSARMDKYTKMVAEQGVIALIGKGERSAEAQKLLKEYNIKYFTAYGGIACVLRDCVKNAEICAFEDLGTEAIHKLLVENLPLKVN